MTDELAPPVFVEDEEIQIEPPVFIAQKTHDETGVVVPNFPFFPDIVLKEFQQEFNANNSIPEAEQVQAIQESMQWVNDDLLNPASNDGRISWVNKQQAAGLSCIDEVYSRLDNAGVSEKKTAYLTAIYSKAKSILVARFPDVDLSKQGTNAAAADFETSLEKQVAGYVTTARESIRFIMDIPHFSIELI